MPPKSRSLWARKRRRMQREMKRVLERAAESGDSLSSDDDIGEIPPPVPMHILADTREEPDEVMGEQESTSAAVCTQQPPDSPCMSKEHHGRPMQGRRVLYGTRRTSLVLSDESSADDASFSDNAPATDAVAPQLSDDEDTDVENAFQHRPISSSEASGYSDNSDDVEDEVGFRQRIADFVQNHYLSVVATAELLQLFRRAGVHGLPKDRRALLKTPRTISGVQEKCGGSFKYFGLKTGLATFLQSHPTFVARNNTLTFTVNMDGVPLYKSTSDQFWPLLCQVGRDDPFLVALYYGMKKPDCISDFLQEFLEEYNELRQQGLHHGEKHYNVKLLCWVCDAPARCLLKNTKGHTGYYACERCKAKGNYVNNRVTYQGNIIYESRTDDRFAAMAYHNAVDGDTHQNGQHCPLMDVQIQPVSEVVVEVMHNIYLGTWKRLLQFLFAGSRQVCRLSMNQKRQLNEKLVRLRLPNEFSRQPRTIFELDRWKATELRSSLLYTGYIFLKGILSRDMYMLYLRFAVSMNILHADDSVHRNVLLNYARQLILEFIRDAEHLLGPDFNVYNVHCMSHIPDDVEKFQCSLNDISAFPFENHLQLIKKMVRGPTNPLGQVSGRLAERQHQQNRKSKKKLEPYVSAREKDSMFFFEESNEFAMVQRRRHDKRYDVLVFSADATEDFFKRPLPSKMVNVFLVRNLNHKPATPKIVCKRELYHKVVLLPCDNAVDYLLIPMLHDAEVDRQQN
jgi:hypothetical protein